MCQTSEASFAGRRAQLARLRFHDAVMGERALIKASVAEQESADVALQALLSSLIALEAALVAL